ncbi:serine-rich adhesin for platelets isoform X2 [Ceratitis capitata]|nr:serine-rich adhesin for platelets isoform X2 [Ceratitis capitata]XP_020712746.1 serine-rich adhesin for platelets isoform X2 [Ceratitis capitata]XP_023159319.1 serine-rich adhesin for platelets isoform X2 [Ceratitis capitata]
MSASLMSCVRENSPPLDVVDGANCSSNATGPMSLPDCHTMSNVKHQQQQQQLTSTPLSVPNINECSNSGNIGGGGGGSGAGGGGDGTTQNTEPKRRRFHPLRNLRRIFRRRTITNVPSDTPPNINTTNTLPPPTSSTSEKNLRSATLSSISSVVSASSPSSPLTHQQLQEAYSSQSLPKSKSYSISGGTSVGSKAAQHRDALLATVLGGKHKQQQQQQQQQQVKQQLQQQHQQLEEVNVTDSDMYTTHASHTASSSMYHHHHHHHHHHQTHQQVGSSGGVLFQPPHSVRQSLGVAVLPSAMNRSFYAERQKLRSIGDSSQELDSSGNDSGSANNTTMSGSGSGGGGSANGGGRSANSEISDSQRSLSEGRLVDSDYSHDPLSQSHDSVFSESASASLFSNRDYQAELSDVLRKRNRNRQDASEEDLGLPRSPASPQRRVERTQRSHHITNGSNNNNANANATATSSSATTGGNQSEVSSLSLLSMNSGDGDDLFASSTANNSTISTKEFMQERALSTSLGGRSLTRSSTVSTTSVTSEIYRHSSSGSLGNDSTRDEPDLLGAKCQRLSHSAAKHKMALRPAKKKGPSRMHRRTLETSIPEANEDSLRLASNTLLDIKEHDVKAKTRSLPPSVTTKILDQHAVESKKTTSPTKSAKTKSTTSSNEQILHVKRSKIEKLEKGNESGGKSTLLSTTTTTNNSSSTITAATSLFGLRTLTAKATALFEPPQESSTDPTPSEQELKREKEREKLKEKEKEKIKEKEKETTNAAGVESSESGFLRRLIQRNSKRSGSRSNATGNSNQPTDVKSDASQSVVDAKSKVQISTSCMDMKQTPESSLTKLDKSRSAISYEQNIEETRKDIKREIMSVGSTGLNAMLNTHKLTTQNEQSMKDAVTLSATTTSPQKPKSGAAARQRYLPQDIGSLDRKLGVTASSSTTTATESYTSSTSSILSKCSQQEVFQSTSIIREITASQASSVNSVCSLSKSTEHHFEKKPKIVGLSAFQQKISRSNDSVGRFAGSNGSLSANSTTSLDAAGETRSHNIQEQKQRKIVEKSRSFRIYQEDAYNSASPAVHNNMPSLPDLTMNLRVPCYNELAKDSPVAEARDLGTTPRATESTGNLTVNNYNFTKNITVKGTPTKLTPLSPVNSFATAELSAAHEPTSSNDLLSKSPFINVLRKPTSSTSLEEKPVVLTVNASSSTRKSVEQINTITKAAPVSLITVVPPQMPDLVKVEPQQQLQQQLRPKVLHLRDSNASIETSTSTSTDDLRLTPTTAAVVSLREKPTKAKPSATVSSARNSMDLLAGAKDVERKSAPAPVAQTNKMQSVKTTRRSTSLMDSPPPASSPNGSEERSGVSKQIEPTSGSSSPNDDGVPEFMRIQLNRVDPARIAKSANVVLAKNVREIHPPNQQQPQAQQEKSPQQEKTPQVKSPQPQLTKEANGSERNTSLDELNLRRLSNESVEIIEKSSPTEVDKQKPIFELQAKSTSNAKSPTKTQVALSALPPRSPVKKQQSVVAITPTTPTTPTPDVDDSVVLRAKKPEPATPDASTISSNKLSLQERKRLFMSEEKLKTDKRIEELRNERKKSITEEVYRKSFAKSEEKLDTGEKTPNEGVVMLRKKSFCAAIQVCAATNGKRDDPTPELMKVFARRSLKIKDEDINALADKLHASNGGDSGGGSGSVGGSKKFTANQQNVDSDKENQSASEEKLDKLPKQEATLELQSLGGGKLSNGINNRNSLADFRSNKSTTAAAAAAAVSNGCTNGLSLNNGNFNKNNHNNNNSNSNNNNHTAANSNSNNTSTTVNNTTANSTSTTTPTTTNGSLGSLGVNIASLSAGNRSSFLPTIKVAGFRNLPIERNNSVSKIYPTTACEALNNNNNNNNNNGNNNNLNNNHHQLGHGHQQPTHQQQNGKTRERQSLNMKALESNNSNNSNSSGGSSSSVLSSSSSGGGGGSGSCKTIERSATVSEFKGIHQRRAEWEQRAKEALK